MKNVTIIGGGPGGYSAAVYCSRLGMKATLIEKAELGGTCLNQGCIPTKTLVHIANLYDAVLKADSYGISTDKTISIDFDKITRYKNRTVNQLRNGIKYLMKKNDVTVIQGTGYLLDQNTVIAEGCQETIKLHSDAIILATGSQDMVLPGFEPDQRLIFTGAGMLDMTSLPEKTIIIGGGIIGVEFASILNRFGKEVVLVEKANSILPSIDREISAALQEAMEAKGIRILTSAKAEKILEKTETTIALEFSLNDGRKEHITSDRLLVSIGRTANLHGLGLEGLGIAHTGTHIITDEQMRTSVDGIYAIGDLTSTPMLAHVACYEAKIAAFTIAGKKIQTDLSAVPTCIFSAPEVACVGLTEAEAKKRYGNIEVYKADFAGNGKAAIEKKNYGFAKMIVAGEDKQIVGFSLIGPGATELITEPAMGIQLHLKAESMASVIYAHPTFSEIIGEAAADVLNLKLNE